MFKQLLGLDLFAEALDTAAATFGLPVGRVGDAIAAGLLRPGDDVEVA